jgi:hypothetical protein
MSSDQIGLGDDMDSQWNVFTAKLCNGHTRIKEEIDCLIWNQNKVGGYYTIKLGYEVMMALGGHAP